PGDRRMLPQPRDCVEKNQSLLQSAYLKAPFRVERLSAIVREVALSSVVGGVAIDKFVVSGVELTAIFLFVLVVADLVVQFASVFVVLVFILEVGVVVEVVVIVARIVEQVVLVSAGRRWSVGPEMERRRLPILLGVGF